MYETLSSRNDPAFSGRPWWLSSKRRSEAGPRTDLLEDCDAAMCSESMLGLELNLLLHHVGLCAICLFECFDAASSPDGTALLTQFTVAGIALITIAPKPPKALLPYLRRSSGRRYVRVASAHNHTIAAIIRCNRHRA